MIASHEPEADAPDPFLMPADQFGKRRTVGILAGGQCRQLLVGLASLDGVQNKHHTKRASLQVED